MFETLSKKRQKMNVDLAQGNAPLLEFGDLGDKPRIVDTASSKSNLISIPDDNGNHNHSVKSRKSKKKHKKHKKMTHDEIKLMEIQNGIPNTYDATMLPIMNKLIVWTPTSISQICGEFKLLSIILAIITLWAFRIYSIISNKEYESETYFMYEILHPLCVTYLAIFRLRFFKNYFYDLWNDKEFYFSRVTKHDIAKIVKQIYVLLMLLIAGGIIENILYGFSIFDDGSDSSKGGTSSTSYQLSYLWISVLTLFKLYILDIPNLLMIIVVHLYFTEILYHLQFWYKEIKIINITDMKQLIQTKNQLAMVKNKIDTRMKYLLSWIGGEFIYVIISCWYITNYWISLASSSATNDNDSDSDNAPSLDNAHVFYVIVSNTWGFILLCIKLFFILKPILDIEHCGKYIIKSGERKTSRLLEIVALKSIEFQKWRNVNPYEFAASTTRGDRSSIYFTNPITPSAWGTVIAPVPTTTTITQNNTSAADTTDINRANTVITQNNNNNNQNNNNEKSRTTNTNLSTVATVATSSGHGNDDNSSYEPNRASVQFKPTTPTASRREDGMDNDYNEEDDKNEETKRDEMDNVTTQQQQQQEEEEEQGQRPHISQNTQISMWSRPIPDLPVTMNGGGKGEGDNDDDDRDDEIMPLSLEWHWRLMKELSMDMKSHGLCCKLFEIQMSYTNFVRFAVLLVLIRLGTLLYSYD